MPSLREKILEEIRKGVINLTYRRRGIITNISHLSGKKKGNRRGLKYKFCSLWKDEMVIFDIYRGEGIRKCLGEQRDLECPNDKGMMLKGGVRGFVPH